MVPFLSLVKVLAGTAVDMDLRACAHQFSHVLSLLLW